MAKDNNDLKATNTALIPCPKCGHRVSKTARSCPDCGHPIGVLSWVLDNKLLLAVTSLLGIFGVNGLWFLDFFKADQPKGRQQQIKSAAIMKDQPDAKPEDKNKKNTQPDKSAKPETKSSGKELCVACQGKKICPKCNGNAKAVCLKCKEGKIPCDKCDAKGKLTCSRCQGRGIPTHETDPCKKCDGKGFLVCTKCGGKSMSRCSNCGGKGYTITCMDCSGKGICQACNGKGLK